jgi:hypothetical protein
VASFLIHHLIYVLLRKPGKLRWQETSFHLGVRTQHFQTPHRYSLTAPFTKHENIIYTDHTLLDMVQHQNSDEKSPTLLFRLVLGVYLWARYMHFVLLCFFQFSVMSYYCGRFFCSAPLSRPTPNILQGDESRTI